MRIKFRKEEYDFWIMHSINIIAIQAGLQEARWYSYLMFSFISRIFEDGKFFLSSFRINCVEQNFTLIFLPLVNNSCLLLLWI